jgi:hypothetical protein
MFFSLERKMQLLLSLMLVFDVVVGDSISGIWTKKVFTATENAIATVHNTDALMLCAYESLLKTI